MIKVIKIAKADFYRSPRLGSSKKIYYNENENEKENVVLEESASLGTKMSTRKNGDLIKMQMFLESEVAANLMCPRINEDKCTSRATVKKGKRPQQTLTGKYDLKSILLV